MVLDKGASMTQWTDALGRPKECIHRYTCSLVGLTHPNKNGTDRVGLARGLQIGTRLALVPEPDNAFDRNAVLIFRFDDLENDLGYIHAMQAKRICRMIECGATFDAEVYWIDKQRPEFPDVYMWLYQLTLMTRSRRPTRYDAPTYRTTKISHSPEALRRTSIDDKSKTSSVDSAVRAVRFFAGIIRRLFR
jgi:hypothetical protein